MSDFNVIKINSSDNTIIFKPIKVTVHDDDHDVTSEWYFKDEDEYNQWIVDYLNKHAKINEISKETIDTSDFKWMEGIELRTSDTGKEIEEIYSYGSREAYEASLPSATDEYLLNLDAEIALLKLGLNE